MDIMMRLKGVGLSMLAHEFQQREKRLGGGLPLVDFVEIMLRGLPRTKSVEEKQANVHALVDLFEAIDINGDGVMEFEEFTSYCVDAGMVATRLQTTVLKHRYVRQNKKQQTIKIGSGCVGIEKLKWSPEFQRFLVLEHAAKAVKLYNAQGKWIADIAAISTVNGFPLTPRANAHPHDGGGARDIVDGSQQYDDPSPQRHPSSASASATGPGMFILDAVFIWKNQWLAMSTTEFTISFYDMDASRRSPLDHVLPVDHKVAAASNAPQFELIRRLTTITTTAQLLLRFSEQSGYLFSSGNDFVITVWKFVDSETKVLWKRLLTHRATVMDVVEIPEHDLLASCDLQKTIQLWDLHDCRSRGALVGHTHGLRHLVYSKQHDLLLSAGFEFEAYAWDLASRQVVLTLSGHRAHLVGIQLAMFQTERAITADSHGVFKVWDISRNSAGSSSHVGSSTRQRGATQAVLLESIDPVSQVSRFEPTCFICLHPVSRDLWTAAAGSATLHLFRSVRIHQADDIPLRAFYHYNRNKFIVISGPVCSIWDGETGGCLEEFTHVGRGIGKDYARNATAGNDENMGGKRNNSHNGTGSSHSSDQPVEVLICAQDAKCKKLVVVSEQGDMGVFNCQNFVPMRKCRENFRAVPIDDDGNAKVRDRSPSCGIVGLHYCSANKLIVAADTRTQAIIVIDDANHDAAGGITETSVLRRLTRIPGGVASSAYSYHASLIATISADEESSISLWDFESLGYVSSCECQPDTIATSMHVVEFWEEFPILIGADVHGGVSFFATMPLINANTGRMLHTFQNDRLPLTHINVNQTNLDKMSSNCESISEKDGESKGNVCSTFLTETITKAANKMMKRSTISTQESTKDSNASPKSAAAVVTCLKIAFDDTNNCYLLFTGDERGYMRIWDLTCMMRRLSLCKIPTVKCKCLQRGYQPRAVFSRDFSKELAMKQQDEQQRQNPAVFRHHQAFAQPEWPSLVEDLSQVSSMELKRLSRRRMDARKKTSGGAVASRGTRLPPASTAATATAAAEAFLFGKRKSTFCVGNMITPSRFRKSVAKPNLGLNQIAADENDVILVRGWNAHGDGLTSLEVTKNPNIIVTCALDMRVFVWDWHGTCLGKLFDADNVGRWPWRFRQDDSRRLQERQKMIDDLIREIELSPGEKLNRRRDTLYQQHVQHKSRHELHRVSTLLVDHLVSKSPELQVLESEEIDITNDAQVNAALAKHQQRNCQAKHVMFQQLTTSQTDNTSLSPSLNIEHSTEKLLASDDATMLNAKLTRRWQSLDQVGPLLCVNSFDRETTTAPVRFADPGNLNMDKKYLEQELLISFPTSSASNRVSGGDSGDRVITAMQNQLHDAAETALVNRTTLERKSIEMYTNLEHMKCKTKAKRTTVSAQLSPASEASWSHDGDILIPSSFLQKHLPTSALAIRPHTAPATKSPSRTGLKISTKLLTQSKSTDQFSLSRRTSVLFRDGRKNSLDVSFMEQIHQKNSGSRNIGVVGKGRSKRYDGGFGVAAEMNDNQIEQHPALYKLHTINNIIAKVHNYCDSTEKIDGGGGTSLIPSRDHSSTVQDQRLSLVASTPVLTPLSSVLVHAIPEQDESVDDKDYHTNGIFLTAKKEATRVHLEATKEKMYLSMAHENDNRHLHNRLLPKQTRQMVQQQKKVKRMEDYLQQKRREMNANIGNVFKRTSFAFQSQDSDMIKSLEKVKQRSERSMGRRASINGTNKAKARKREQTFGIYGVREVMSVIRLFWSMDEDSSGEISLAELLTYKHFFEKLGYNDMASVFQAIDKDGNGHISLKELLEICFQYATKYQLEEMLKLAKVGNVRSYLQGIDPSISRDVATLAPEHRDELYAIFQVFDRNGDGAVSMDEIMEALRVDDDDIMAKVMANNRCRSEVATSGITKQDVEKFYREYDLNGDHVLNFDEFIVLMCSLYGPRAPVGTQT